MAEQRRERLQGGRVPLERLLTHRTGLAGVAADLPRWTTEKRGLVKALVEMASFASGCIEVR